MNCFPPIPEEQPGYWERGGQSLGLQVWHLHVVGVELEAQPARSGHSQEHPLVVTPYSSASPPHMGQERKLRLGVGGGGKGLASSSPPLQGTSPWASLVSGEGGHAWWAVSWVDATCASS